MFYSVLIERIWVFVVLILLLCCEFQFTISMLLLRTKAYLSVLYLLCIICSNSYLYDKLGLSLYVYVNDRHQLE